MDLAHRGQPSKALSALASKGSLSMGDADVRAKFTELQDPHGSTESADVPLRQWKQFVAEEGASYDIPPASSPLYRFRLGTSTITAKDGAVKEVDTLEYVLKGVDHTSSPGISGLDFALLRNVDARVLAPLLEPYFGHEQWDHEDPYLRDTHTLLVSNLAVGLDKTGHRRAEDLRPIGVGESLRRIAAQCVLLQEGGDLGERLAARGQFGVGVKNGTETIYLLTMKALESLYSMDLAGAAAESDAVNAYCSICRSAIQRGIAKHAPHLLPIFDFLYGPEAFARAFFYAGAPSPVGSCALPSGVHQGDVLGPLLFALGFDELMEMLRSRMANLPVDSTMIGKEVKFAANAEVVRDESGAAYLPLPTDKFRLVAAPAYQHIEAEGFVASPDLQVSVQLSPGGVEVEHHLGLFSVQWSHTKLEASPLIVAYLDDIKMADELFLMRPFSQLLKKHGPEIGLFFGKRAKNCCYVPLPLRHQVTSMYQDAVIVDEDSPGDSPSDKLKEAAEGNALSAPENLSRLLFTTCGVERLMGSPLRLVEREGGPAETSKAWLRQQVVRMAEATASLFAHIGLDAVDEAAGVLGFDNYTVDVPCLPKADPQVQNFVARYTLARRLNHVTRVLPPTIIQEPLSRIEQMIAAVVAGLMRTKLPELPLALRRRLTLPARWSGSMPRGGIGAPCPLYQWLYECRKATAGGGGEDG